MCSFIENQHDTQLLGQLVEYLRPKLFSLENEELAQFVTSMVLLANICDEKMIKAVESLVLRRIHSFETNQLTRILKAYSLMNTGSVPKSVTLIK